LQSLQIPTTPTNFTEKCVTQVFELKQETAVNKTAF